MAAKKIMAFHPISFQISAAVTMPQNQVPLLINCTGASIIPNHINRSFTIPPSVDNIFVTIPATTTHDTKCGRYVTVCTVRSEEHTSELQSLFALVFRLLLGKICNVYI